MIYGNVRGYANSKWTYSWLSALRRLKLARMPRTPLQKTSFDDGQAWFTICIDIANRAGPRSVGPMSRHGVLVL